MANQSAAKNLDPKEIRTPEELVAALAARNDFGDLSSERRSVANIFADCQGAGAEPMLRRCISATVELRAADLCLAAKEAIPDGYNWFNHGIIAAILFVLLADRDGVVHQRAIDSVDRDYTFRFGREGSPVLYIRSRHRIWLETLVAIEKAAGADEFSVELDGSIRIWWD